MSDVPVKSVKKALDLFSLLVFDDPEMRGIELNVLSSRLGLPANTAHNLLKTMSVCGYVAQNSAGRYIAGPKSRRIGLLNQVENNKFKEKLSAMLERYTTEINEAMVFVTLHGGKRVVLIRTEPVLQAIRIDQQVVDAASIYEQPTGRILAAFAGPDDYRLILKNYGPPDKLWPGFERDMEKIRKERQCLLLPDTRGISAFALPVNDRRGQMLGAVGCYSPAFRCDQQSRDKILSALHRAAAEISEI
ncbi:MAG: helix-turn-helix domain-containing protein [Victivallaceae bacterium]|jgi:DNA-binding IclR family transcriptional regulator